MVVLVALLVALLEDKMTTRKPRLYNGLPVVDAPKDTGIAMTVTPADVKGSKKGDPANCAAAIAGKRELQTEVHVFLSRAYVKEKKHWVRYLTPESVSREIVSFDRGSAFTPGDYQFRAPRESERLGQYKGKFTRKTGTTGRRPHHVTANVREWRRAK
jgi:hypothetical protein